MKESDTYTEIVWDIMKEIEFGDPNFDFLASLLSYGLANDGYTQKQIKYIEKYKKKYQYIWFDEPSSELKIINGGKHDE